jgi:hypothetical protein
MMRFGLPLVAMLAAGCQTGDVAGPTTGVDQPAEEAPTGAAAEEIKNGSYVTSDYYSQPAVWVQTDLFGGLAGTCTGTVISPRHILTASHCGAFARQYLLNQWVGTRVKFFGTNYTLSGSWINVTNVQLAPGVDPGNEDYEDVNGDLADFAVLTLASNIPSNATVANMQHRFLYDGITGMAVGAGAHNDGNGPAAGNLMYRYSTLESTSDSDGEFHLDGNQVDYGDSGGPFYVGGRVMGVLYGLIHIPFDDSSYTSVPHHLSRILDMIGYQTTLYNLTNYIITGGTEIPGQAFITADRDVCAYACERTSSCAGYNYLMGICNMYSTIGGYSYAPGWYSGVK